jgi:hypothetical protein
VPFTVNPDECGSVSSTISATDDATPTAATATGSSSFTVINCPSPEANPLTIGGASTANGDLTEKVSETYSPAPSGTAPTNPTLTTQALFTYGDASTCSATVAASGQCEWLQNATITLPSGVLANPGAASAECTSAQWLLASAPSTAAANPCPAGSLIGTGTYSAANYDYNHDGGNGVDGGMTVKAYLLPSSGNSNLAEVGLLFYYNTSVAVGVAAPASLNSNGQVQLSFSNLPNNAPVGSGGAQAYFQLTQLSLAINPTLSTQFTSVQAGCSTLVTSLTATETKDATSPITAASETKPTGC